MIQNGEIHTIYGVVSSDKETISNVGNARYLTIELEEYLGELKSYPENNKKPWLCKRVKEYSKSI